MWLAHSTLKKTWAVESYRSRLKPWLSHPLALTNYFLWNYTSSPIKGGSSVCFTWNEMGHFLSSHMNTISSISLPSPTSRHPDGMNGVWLPIYFKIQGPQHPKQPNKWLNTEVSPAVSAGSPWQHWLPQLQAQRLSTHCQGVCISGQEKGPKREAGSDPQPPWQLLISPCPFFSPGLASSPVGCW